MSQVIDGHDSAKVKDSVHGTTVRESITSFFYAKIVPLVSEVTERPGSRCATHAEDK